MESGDEGCKELAVSEMSGVSSDVDRLSVASRFVGTGRFAGFGDVGGALGFEGVAGPVGEGGSSDVWELGWIWWFRMGEGIEGERGFTGVGSLNGFGRFAGTGDFSGSGGSLSVTKDDIVGVSSSCELSKVEVSAKGEDVSSVSVYSLIVGDLAGLGEVGGPKEGEGLIGWEGLSSGFESDVVSPTLGDLSVSLSLDLVRFTAKGDFEAPR